MANRDQDRAAVAFEHVSGYEGDGDKSKARARKYATIVHKMPSLLQSAGLCQALHFVASRPDDDQKKYVDHMAQQLSRCVGGDRKLTGKQLLEQVRQAPLGEYLMLTDEAMACAAWYRRLVQGVLKIEAAEEDSEG